MTQLEHVVAVARSCERYQMRNLRSNASSAENLHSDVVAADESESVFCLVVGDQLLHFADNRVERADVIKVGEDEGLLGVETARDNVSHILITLENQKKQKGPRILHVITTKGKGLPLAEEEQIIYHAPGKFDPLTGKLDPSKGNKKLKLQTIFGETLLNQA